MTLRYAAFSLELDGGQEEYDRYDELRRYQLDGSTSPQRNAKNPRWDESIKLWLPAGTGAAMVAASRKYPPKMWQAAFPYLTPAEQERLTLPPEV